MGSTISRKDFFKELFGFFKQEVEKGSRPSLRHSSNVLPPPGAQSVEHYLQNCTQCYECVSVCPPLALEVCREAASQFYGYPVINPKRELCSRCADYPCIQACPTPALTPENAARPLLRAQIVKEYCLAYQGHFCLSCLNACQENAIKWNAQGVPEVAQELCTACGLCVPVCPAPKQAIVFQLTVS